MTFVCHHNCCAVNFKSSEERKYGTDGNVYNKIFLKNRKSFAASLAASVQTVLLFK